MTIWVGIDGSVSSQRALEWALGFAAGRDEEVAPVSCWTFPAMALAAGALLPPAAAMTDATMAATQKVVDAALENVPASTPVNDPLIVQGEPSEVLSDLSNGNGIVVVGNRGRGGFEGLVLGSVSGRLTGSAHCPLVIVPNTWSPGDGESRVVVGYATPADSQSALEWATTTYPTVNVDVVHTWQLPAVYGLDHVSFEPANYQTGGEKMLAAAVGELEGEAAEKVHIHVTRGDARHVLLDRATGAGALVIGSQRHRGVWRWVLGSVAQAIVHHLTCPTILIPATTEAEAHE